MGIGYLLLYAALAVVALWLVAELLLQNRAPLHWRALALVGFLGVAGGMGLRSVPVIGAGAAMFAVGQTLVTLSVKRGYTAGWSLRKADDSLPGPLAKVPLLGALTGGAAAATAVEAADTRVGEVSAVEAPPEPALAAEAVAEVEQTAAFEMQEMAADGVYMPGYYEQQQPQDPYVEAYQAGYDPVQQQTSYDQQQWQAQQQPAFAYDQGYGAYQQQPDPYGGYQQQDQYAGYQQQQTAAWDPNAQHQQWQQQPDQHQMHQQGIPQQPSYEHGYGYQQQSTWHQG
ncbi:hypothetical protein F7Q99_06055 [Streptomyces kaniharaensis]|uniref:Uncharacterized protein n=1 Tax=Streptomyces kaniharaensis TaxID=212423 RepID=A0A6N7KP28_9ACTN|nr:hypothetical protein [Streptomyces kaniharaensis]MQS11864.1 hypothetical protein [Streptomyces kaniharaensis]